MQPQFELSRRERRAANTAMRSAFAQWCETRAQDDYLSLAHSLNTAAAQAVRIVRDERTHNDCA